MADSRNGRAQSTKDEKVSPHITADYLMDFKCIGSACEDNCCVGWDVDIDQATYKKYTALKDEVLTGMFKKHVHKNPYCYSAEVDFAVVKLTKQKQCPFLDHDRLCRIQARMGESYLSNVCHTFPRYTNRVDGIFEHSATVSCPEIARKMLLNPKGIQFYESTATKGRHILTNDLKTTDIGKHETRANVLFFKELRAFSLKLMQNRSYELWERLLILGYLCETLEKGENVMATLNTFIRDIDSGTVRLKYGHVQTDVSAQMTLLQEVAEKLNVFSEVDSRSYIDFTRQCLQGLGEMAQGKSTLTTHQKSERYQMAAMEYYEPYMKCHDYILENFLVNFIFKNLFPYSETYTFTEAYMTLVIRYALVRMNLIGLAAHHKGLKDELVVAYIQSFSKTVEHHRTYLDDMVLLLQTKGYRELKKLAVLLKN